MKNMVTISVLCLSFWVADGFAQVAVIAHKSVPITEIKKAQLMDFYTGDIRVWSNGAPVKVLDLKPKGEARDTFYAFLGKSPSRMKSIWMKRMLSGEGDPPDALASEEEMMAKVSSTPGALGFVSLDKITEDVKVLLVIGRDVN